MIVSVADESGWGRWVQTDMGNAGALAHGMTEAPTTIVECVDGIVDKIDNSTRVKHFAAVEHAPTILFENPRRSGGPT